VTVRASDVRTRLLAAVIKRCPDGDPTIRSSKIIMLNIG
jgi:hypothetical protein